MEIGNMEIGNMEIGQVEIGASNQAVEVYYPLSEHSGSPSSVSPPIPMPAEHQASFISPLNSAGASNSLGSTASVSFPASSSSHASASSSTSTHLEANKQTNLPFTNIFQILFHTDDEEMATTAEPPSSEDPESPCSSLEDFANSVNDLIRVPKTAPLKMTSSVVNPPNPANPYLDLILGTAQPIFHDLLALYFTHVAPFSPIIHRTTFLSNPSSYPPLLLNAMYAAASLYAPTSPETQGRGYAAAPFLARARALLDPLAKPDLRTVQALVLLIKSGAAARKLTIRETDALVAMAAGLIRASRFDQPDSTHRVSPVRASEIKRTVAIIWMLDVYLKALNDRTASFSPTFTPARDPGSIPCTDPGWVIPSQGPVANITLFLSARDAIVLPPTSPSNDLVQTDPHAAILEIHRLFSSAHEMHCPSLSPAIASPSSILSRAEALQSAYRTARLASPVYLCGRTLAHSGMNILLYKQGGWDFSELVMDLEAAMLAIQGTGGWLELGSPFAAWYVHLSCAGVAGTVLTEGDVTGRFSISRPRFHPPTSHAPRLHARWRRTGR